MHSERKGAGSDKTEDRENILKDIIERALSGEDDQGTFAKMLFLFRKQSAKEDKHTVDEVGSIEFYKIVVQRMAFKDFKKTFDLFHKLNDKFPRAGGEIFDLLAGIAEKLKERVRDLSRQEIEGGQSNFQEIIKPLQDFCDSEDKCRAQWTRILKDTIEQNSFKLEPTPKMEKLKRKINLVRQFFSGDQSQESKSAKSKAIVVKAKPFNPKDLAATAKEIWKLCQDATLSNDVLIHKMNEALRKKEEDLSDKKLFRSGVDGTSISAHVADGVEYSKAKYLFYDALRKLLQRPYHKAILDDLPTAINIISPVVKDSKKEESDEASRERKSTPTRD